MIKLFTHTDLDGIGCAILAKLAFGTEVVDIEYCNYDDIDSKVEEYFNSGSEYECHITDISINNELANKISNSEKKYQLLDHHPTALGLNEFGWCNVQIENEETNIKTSGTEMYYHWLINNNYLSKPCLLYSAKTLRIFSAGSITLDILTAWFMKSITLAVNLLMSAQEKYLRS